MSELTQSAAPSAPARPFFNRRDQLAGWTAGLVALAGYWWTLPPSVGLEDSGEFLTAARHLGVPHPPGYPIWTILAWLWQLLLPVGAIAWRVNLMSAVFGAAAVGLTALLISKSGHVLARRVGFFHEEMNRAAVDWIIFASAVAAALMLAFSPVLWSQSIISEVYALNAFFLLVTLLLLYRWSFTPHRRWRLYLAAVVWGLSLTNHQTLVLLTVAFPAYVWFVDRGLGRDTLVPILAVILLGALKLALTPGGMFHQGPFSGGAILAVGVGAGVWLYFLITRMPGLMQCWRQAVALYGAVAAGLALYLYLPVSSATNPPMNWGYTRTVQGFFHHFTRGQYEKVHTERTLLQFWGQLNMFFDDLQQQFNIVFALLALLALFFYRDLPRRERDWLKFLLIAFLFLGIGFIFLSNPGFDKQKQFTDRVFFLPGHCLYALWIGYGLILGLGFVLLRQPTLAGAAGPLAGLVLLLPVVSVWRNWADNEQRGHDFGYRFGYLMFKPGGGYPDMEPNAVLYGGTDPGRFVPTYMIFVESQVTPRGKTRLRRFAESGTFDRRDVYIITQNALADGTYMSYIRDHYDYNRPDPTQPATLTKRPPWQNALLRAAWGALGRSWAYPREPIWIPSEQDSQGAFQMYVEELRTRPAGPGEDVKIEGGRVQVQGVQGVMNVNGILTKMIFDKNKDKHAFYVEESYVIPWMYPHLEPAGIIMKINRDPLPALTAAQMARDRQYWDELAAELKALPAYRRDDVAQKTFSKLRSAIGGVYAYRKMYAAAEYAYQQAVELCPDSPEANFRLAQLCVEQARPDDGIAILANYQKRDPHNTKVRDAINTIKDLKLQAAETERLEQQYAANPNDLAVTLQLVRLYAARQRLEAMNGLVAKLVARPDLPANEFLGLADLYARLRQLPRVTELLTLFTQRYPANPIGWYNLAIIHSVQNDCALATRALEQALAHDPPPGQLHTMARQDPRFAACRNDPKFSALLGELPPVLLPPPAAGTGQLGTPR